MTIGAAIPAYRDAERLRRCLRSIETCAPHLLASTVVVDDSDDGRVKLELRNEFPGVKWITHRQNLGFGKSATEAVIECDREIVVLLNDDTELLCNPVPHLERHFSNESVFAVTFQSVDEHGAFREGAKRLVWRLGMPKILHNPGDQDQPVGGIQRSSYAVGGHAAFRRSCFAELSGFDPLFDPFYWEDVDLAIRARQRGWEVHYEPECKVLHREDGAIRSSQATERIREITQRNRLLFGWRHCPAHLRALMHAHTFARRLTGFGAVHGAAQERWEEFRIKDSPGNYQAE